MAEPLKNYYSPDFVREVAQVFDQVSPSFDQEKFLRFVLDAHWEQRELRERTNHLKDGLTHCLSDNYPLSFKHVCEASYQLKGGLYGFFLPDYIAEHGIRFWDESMAAFEVLTVHSTAEFAIRPFLHHNFEKGMQQMRNWSHSDNEHHRRLASEGTRSRLPWAKKVQALHDAPERMMELLSTMMEDASEYVRRSVANNLNDISKAEPNLVKAHCRQWIGMNEQTDKLIKHGLRTLLKQGDREALELIGLNDARGITVVDFHCSEEVTIGEQLMFSATISNTNMQQPLRIEYVIYYNKPSGAPSKKVFHWSLNEWGKQEKKTLSKKQSFANMTTRKHYPGEHRLELVVNGEVLATAHFNVKD